MKSSIFKRILTVVLTAAIAFCTPLCIGVSAAQIASYPIIYLPDITDISICEYPDSLTAREVFSTDSDEFVNAATALVTGLLTASTDAQKGAEQVNAAIGTMFENIKCDECGNSVNANLGARIYSTPISENTTEPIYTANIKAIEAAAQNVLSGDRIFVFQYDWRMSPIDTSTDLHDYIDAVLESTGSEKVRLISGGYGGIIVNTYLFYYYIHSAANVSSCVFLDSMILGTSIMGDIMSGHLVYTLKDSLSSAKSILDIVDAYDVITGGDVGSALSKYIKQDTTGIISGIFSKLLGTSNTTELLAWITKTIAFGIIEDEGMFDNVGKGYKQMLILADDSLYSGEMGELLRNMPGLWAMVPQDEYEDAIKFMFGSRNNANEELLHKLDAYRVVVKATERTLKDAQTNGINIDIVAGYNLQILPVTATIDEQSDSMIPTKYAGVNVTTAEMSGDEIPDRGCCYALHNHVEPGGLLDASSCCLPENTWFIKDHDHMDYSSSTAATFVCWLSLNDEQCNVYQNSTYPQYMKKALIGSNIQAYSTPSETEYSDCIFGDINNDGVVTSADARLALRYAVGYQGTPTQLVLLQADVDGDGDITSADARLILRHAVGLGQTLAPTRR